MKYAIVYPRSDWPGQGVVESPAEATLSELETMPPYGAVIAGNVLRDRVGVDFVGVLDEYTLDTPLEDTIDRIYAEHQPEHLTLLFSVYVFNNDRVLTIAKRLKARYENLVFVAGGPFASYFVQSAAFDAVIIGDAETGIPAYLESGERVINAPKADPNEVSVDFSVLRNQQRYAQGVVSSMRGCRYRTAKVEGCVFCSMRRSPVEIRRPEIVLREMAHEAETLSAEWFYDGADSFVFSRTWLRTFAAARARFVASGYRILDQLKVFAYANPSDVVDREIPELLWACGVRRVFLGIESGDDGVLARMHKPKASTDGNRRALGLFKGSGIEIRLGIVLGIAEDDTSLRNTYEFLRSIPSYTGVRVASVVLSHVLVLPDSSLYTDLISKRFAMEEADVNQVNVIHRRLMRGCGISKQQINELSRTYVKYTSRVGYDGLLDWKRRMDKELVSQNVGIWTFGGF